MRSITIRLVLAFIGISLLSILIIAYLTHYTTKREFSLFTNERNRLTLQDILIQYYEEHDGWDGLEDAQISSRSTTLSSNETVLHHSVFLVTDVNGTVVRSDGSSLLGQVVSTETLENARPIEISGQTIGYLVITPQPISADTTEGIFLSRLDSILLAISAVAMIVAAVSGLILSRSITRPIRDLTKATREISMGDFNNRVPVRSRDEMGELAESFNRMSAELSRSQYARRQMTADIAHELRTPLSLILGHAEGVHDGVLLPTRENFEIIREEAIRLEHLVEDLRTLSLADAGELGLEKQLF